MSRLANECSNILKHRTDVWSSEHELGQAYFDDAGRKHPSIGLPIVAYEVTLSLQRLLKKYGSVLRAEWDQIVDILMRLRSFLSRIALDKREQSPETQDYGEEHFDDERTSGSSKHHDGNQGYFQESSHSAQ